MALYAWHLPIVVNFLFEIAYRAYVIFFVLVPEGGGGDRSWARRRRSPTS